MKRALFAAVAWLCATLPAEAGVRPYDLHGWLESATAVRPSDTRAWHLNLGMGAMAAPDYRGGEDYTTHPLPLIDLEWRDAFFVSTQRGVGVALLRRRQFKAGVRFTLDPGRDSGVNPHLSPLASVDATPEAGLFAVYYKGPWRVDADIRRGFAGGHDGLLLSFGVAYGSRIGSDLSVIVGGSIDLADAAYLEAFYGVPTGRATADLPAFTPGGGIRNSEGYIQFIYNIDRNFYLTLDLRGGVMMGDAGQSPVTLADTYAGIGSIFGYRF